MNVPDWLIEGLIFGIVGFVFKVVFGLISKNEEKSDIADEKHESSIKEMNEKFIANDRDLYEKIADLRERMSKAETKLDA